jgi:hypothetical protein
MVTQMPKTLDQKLARIARDPSCRDFILADAKDADMAFGLSSPGRSPEHYAGEARFKTLDDYRDQIRQIVQQELVDIMLMSVSTSDVLAVREKLFDTSPLTAAIRANDTTDIWLAAGTGNYSSQPSRPFQTTTIDHAMCGHTDCEPHERELGADLGLYSITLNNETSLDHDTLTAYREFRLEAERKGFRHFLEVFAPNACSDHCPADVARFMNDSIARLLAGVPAAGRPIFLKIPYMGPEAMESLVRYDSSLVVGILGGSAGTTMDAFHMLWEAKKYGARIALFGRKINNAEDQLSFIHYLRAVADDQIEPGEAVRAYHGSLQKLGIPATRTLDEDLQVTTTHLSYGGGSATVTSSRKSLAPAKESTQGFDKEPDFSKMTPAEKVQWNLERWRRILD